MKKILIVDDEEVIRMLIDRGAITQEENRWVIDQVMDADAGIRHGPPPSAAVPA